MLSLSLTVVADDGELAVRLDGPLVAGTCCLLSAWLHRHLPRTTQYLLLDVSGVPEVDADGLGVLLAARRRLEPDACVVLAGARPVVAERLRRSGLARLLPDVAAGETPGPATRALPGAA